MSYPSPRYFPDSGHLGASFRPAAEPPELVTATIEVDYFATNASTGGEFGLYRYVMNERRSGPDPHFHRTISEPFFVLSGTVRLYDGARWLDATAGDFLYVVTVSAPSTCGFSAATVSTASPASQ